MLTPSWLLTLVPSLVLVLAACGDDESLPRTPPDAGDEDGGGVPSIGVEGDAACAFIGEQEHDHTSEAAMHVSEPLPASAYNSEPPSSGPHCSVWGQYARFDEDAPLPACNFIHNLEHGAIALLYNCPSGCPELVDALDAVRAGTNSDPDCRVPRVLLTPYTEMDALVAAAAWGHTWTSQCFDEGARDSLVAFIRRHIGTHGNAPEPAVCANGSVAP